jgi:hypothetical protein
MVLIQLLLPTQSSGIAIADTDIALTREELVAKFQGLTAYLQAAAQGLWTSGTGARERDSVVLIEILADDFDRAWWRAYSRELARRFRQEVIHVRALSVEVLDDRAV